LTGTASLVADSVKDADVRGISEEMLTKMSDKKLIAVRVEVKETELVDSTVKANRNWLSVSRSQLSSWFF